MDVRSCGMQGPLPRGTRAQIEALEPYTCALSRARPGILCFSLDIRLTWMAAFNPIMYGRI